MGVEGVIVDGIGWNRFSVVLSGWGVLMWTGRMGFRRVWGRWKDRCRKKLG